MTRAVRQGVGTLLVAISMAPLIGALDLLADRRIVTALVGLAAGGLLVAAGMRLLVGRSED